MKIGIIGTGWGSRVQVPAFREAGLDVAINAGHANWRDAIDADVELVSIVTPPSEHLEMATAAFEAGKHILSEKPTAMNASEAEQLVALARRDPSRVTIIDHELRFLPAWRAARERIHELGGVRFAEARYSSPGRGDRTRPWNWWSDAARGGGIWGAVGSHFVDALRYFGMEIDAVQALLHTIIDERSGRAVTADDLASVNFRLRGGAIGAMTFNAVSSGPDEASTLTIHCEDGAIRLVNEEALFAKRGGTFERFAGDELASRPGNSPGGAFGSGTVHLAHALRAAIDEGDRDALAPAATFEDGLAQQRVLDAARRSSANDGSWEKV
ncbi:MAG TPA: Gfo/Idh/MocA family oxidoreductase [Thermoanaerobaculia bacterium]|nr:Gfo/Idh/MocA family oxidoreductase [Thermoanaerobaculia bacterium]